ncbi:MAG TPA: GH92 family glycosyl hydrolase [Candidatus Binatia bacterium]|nr:GH92 family glycosyl hydrolase [Candidatus Binatia bacterium]
MSDPAAFVNPFTGTDTRSVDFGTGGGAGNTFPGAVAPFGMIQWSPDTVPGEAASAGGYSYPDSVIRGFSLTHLSGAGCPVFQDVPILPTVTPVVSSPSVTGTYEVAPEYLPSFDHADEDAAPGWYRVRLDPGTAEAIDVELAARTRSAVGRFVFPATTAANVLVNAGGSAMANGDVALAVDPMASEVSGSVAAGQFCYHRNRYTLYFTVRFDRPFAAWGTWTGPAVSPGSTSASGHTDAPFHLRPLSGLPPPPKDSNTVPVGAWATFDTTLDQTVRARVGISYVSVEAARANLAAETPDADVAAVAAETRVAWNDLLGRIAVDGGTPSATRTFYTMLYHSLLAPTVFSDVDGTYPGMDGQQQRIDGWTKHANVSGWDVYRAQVPLLALLDPTRASHLVRSLLADARESGWLPRWPVANGHTDVMVGDPATSIIAGAHALGARDFDTADALVAMVKGATQTGVSANAEYVQRQALADYLRLGWVPHDGTEASSGADTSMFGSTSAVWGSAATTLEYAVADFAIARFAAAVGDRRAARTFQRRSGGWRRLLNRATGYLEPRYASGVFVDGFDPIGGEGFVEGNAAQYRWMVPFDVGGLVTALGGRRTTAALLDTHLERLDEGPLSSYAFLGNEPEQGVPWLYDWLGQPWKTQRVVRDAMATLFDDSPAGYTGNDDLGAMSAWYVFGALGLYPAIPAEGIFALGSPLFPETTLRLAGGDVVITAPGAADGVPYVQGLRLNGRRYDRPWLRFEQLACGARLDFTLAATPDQRWGSARRLAPPSFAPNARPPARRLSVRCE